MNLTIVLPFFDEEALLPFLGGHLERIRSSLGGHSVRVIAVDDGSTDGTAAGLAEIPGLEILTHERNRGPGVVS